MKKKPLTIKVKQKLKFYGRKKTIFKKKLIYVFFIYAYFFVYLWDELMSIFIQN